MNTLQTLSTLDLCREQIAAFSSSDWEGMKQLFTADALYEEVATGVVLRGPEAIVAGLKFWKMAFPDLKGTITRYTGDDRLMAIELSWEGTLEGDLMLPGRTVKATGRRGTIMAAQFVTFAEGRISAIHHYFDVGTILRQAGAAA